MMRVAIIIVAVIVAPTCAYIAGAVRGDNHTCNAPCVVKFDAPMAEDNFMIDYRAGGTLHVTKSEEE